MFRREVARARTFGFLADVEDLWARGLALGASFDNAVVIGDERVINPEGLRYDDEFVRHKALDAVGDLALIGAPILGCYRSFRGGHRLNVEAVKTLVDDRGGVGLGGDAAPAHGSAGRRAAPRSAFPPSGRIFPDSFANRAGCGKNPAASQIRTKALSGDVAKAGAFG